MRPWLLFVAFRSGEALSALMFVRALPTWMPMTWWALMSLSGSLVDAADAGLLRRAGQKQMPQVSSYAYWLSGVSAGSGAYLLFVQGDLGYQGLLNVILISVAALNAQLGVANAPRSMSALILMPLSLRYLLEGGYIPTLMGLGGCLLTAALTLIAQQAKQLIATQQALRSRAEQVADAQAGLAIAKARLFASVSHDLRQPVHAIGLYAESLRGAVDISPRAAQALDGMRQAWQTLDALLAEMLDLTKLDANALQPRLEAVELAPLLHGLLALHMPQAERRRIRLVVLASSGRCVHADPLMLQRVLSNLLANALRFSPEHGRVAMLVRPAHDAQGAPAWRIQVRDAGLGIAAADQQRVFDEFTQLNNPARQSDQGFGLGLSIARRLCELMRGQIMLRSAPGRGTCMDVLLPATQPEPTAAAPNALAPRSAHRLPAIGNGQGLLLVEDDRMVADGMQLLLRDWGYDVMHADSYEAALPLARPGIVALCDVRLPGAQDGLALALALRQAGVQQVLLMTGETGSGLREQARAHGLPLLIKPVAPMDLHRALERGTAVRGQ